MNDAPNWLITVRIEPIFYADANRLLTAIEQLVAEDAAFGFKALENGHVILSGIDEQSLDQKIGELRCMHKVDVNVGAPQVAYRETVARATEVDYTHKKLTGGFSQFALVRLGIEPNVSGAGNKFENKVVGGAVPKEFIPGVEKGVQGVLDAGVLIGFPMMDTKVTLLDGTYHAVDSSALAFEIAARAAMKEGAEKAGVKLLEPIMDVEVVTPGDFVGSVIGDLKSRRGHVGSQEMRDKATVIRAKVPLADLIDYMSNLRSITNGQAKHTIRFDHYAEVPGSDGPDDFRPALAMRA